MRDRIRMCEECCSDKAFVNDTKGKIFGAISTIRRRVACHDCGARFYTYEVDRETFNKLQASIDGPLERGTRWERAG